MSESPFTAPPHDREGEDAPYVASKLVVVSGVDEGLEAPLDVSVEVGTDPACQLVLHDPAVSRRHVVFARTGRRFLVKDRGSTNGTFLGGARVVQAEVPLGAVLTLGNSALSIQPRWYMREVAPSTARSFGELHGESLAMREVFAILERVAPSDVTVLVEGESGTGKEIVARSIHAASRRAGEPYVVFDCGAVPHDLAESELFGHKRGAFTGAVADRSGAFQRAHGGTLCLDEIGELPLDLQPKLLRALENGEVRSVGDDTVRRVDVRTIAATNRDLHAEAQRGRFRQDLLYRLAVVRVRIPPLRHRPEDIPGLVAHFLQGKRVVDDPIDGENLARLVAYAWPGNVRELRNTLARAVALAQSPAGPAPRFSDLVFNLGPSVASPLTIGQNFPGVAAHLPYKDAKGQLLSEFERAYVEALLERHAGNVTQAAAAAGVSRKHLHEMIRRLSGGDGNAGESLAMGDGAVTDPVPPAPIAGARQYAVEDVIAERWEILARAGRGGVGAVYRARDRSLGEDVALKVLGAFDPEALERFRREVKLARNLAHPAICRVYDVGEDRGVPFLTMELIDGENLRERIAARPLSIAEACAILVDVLGALEAAHARGVIHRDLKPENVMLRRGGGAVVVDFGLARAPNAGGGDTTSIAGTPRYMSPEQLRGEPLDARSDLFGVAIVAWELFAGASPFGSGSAAEVTSAILRDDPVRLEVAGVDEETRAALERVLVRALAKRAADRPSSAGEFAAAIVGAMGGGGAAAPSGGLPAPPRRDPTRLIVVATSVAVAVGVAIAIAVPLALRRSPTGARQGEGALGLFVDRFENLTSDRAWDPLCESAADTARGAAGSLGGVRVAPSSGAAVRLVGSVQRVGTRLRIGFQLRSAADAALSPRVEVDGDPGDPAALLADLGLRAGDEIRLVERAHARDVRIDRDTADERARRLLHEYHQLTASAPRPEHIDAGARLLDEALERDPRYVPALVERAYLRLVLASSRGEAPALDAAFADLDRALAIASDDAGARVLMCRARQIAAEFHGAPGDDAIARAFTACRDALVVAPESAQVRIVLARLHDRRCEDEEAMQALDRALELDRLRAGQALGHLIHLALQNNRLVLADRFSRRFVEVGDEERRLGDAAATRRAGALPAHGSHLLRAAVLMRSGSRDEARAHLMDELTSVSAGFGDEWAEAAAIRGLLRLAGEGVGTVPPELSNRLARLEEGFRAAGAVRVAGVYQWIDPDAAIAWLDRAGKADSCVDAIDRAAIYRAAGRTDEARGAMAACRSDEAWVKSCAKWIGAGP